ncbi:MAG: 23S rRNA pseudouridine(1911/1915/1917) synthase RluD [Gammaproteobacteria bacterium]
MVDAQQATVSEQQHGRRFDQVLAELFPDYSRSRLKQWILDGKASLDGEQVIPRAKVREGQRIELHPERLNVTEARAENIPLELVFEDEHVLVVNKPAGLVTHPGAGNADGTLQNGLLYYDQNLGELPRAGILHRLDKDTSGLLLIARSLAAHTRLVRDLEARLLRREYRAVCMGRLTAGGKVDAPVGRHKTQRTRMAVTDRGKPAQTHYRVLHRFTHHSFLALRLETGRTHQIRVHMAHVHHPLLGDPVYGGRLRLPPGADHELTEQLQSFHRQALHASNLGFEHPVSGEPLDFRASLPADMQKLLVALGENTLQADEFEKMVWPQQ